MKQFTDLGLDVAITELDVRVPVANNGVANSTWLGIQSVTLSDTWLITDYSVLEQVTTPMSLKYALTTLDAQVSQSVSGFVLILIQSLTNHRGVHRRYLMDPRCLCRYGCRLLVRPRVQREASLHRRSERSSGCGAIGSNNYQKSKGCTRVGANAKDIILFSMEDSIVYISRECILIICFNNIDLSRLIY
jgi:hypothetical protein